MPNKIMTDLCFNVAQKISTAAMHLDYLKNTPVIGTWLRGAMAQFVECLHEAVIFLAGDRAGEIYNTDETSALTIQQMCKFYGITQPLLPIEWAAGINEVSEEEEPCCATIITH